ncbi:precorrin-2 C(20)-methyltransferase [Ignavigranum ruoffiae]|nr:precorrin-2 C(20)-methyltransferase [Ignavigranum ruoffiae]
MVGKLFAIGVGPGDPKLLTIKATEAFQSIQVIFSPQANAGKRSLALDIAKDYLPESIRIETRYFPMITDYIQKVKQWEQVTIEIEEELNKGNNVGFLTLGDPNTYSTFSYILSRINSKFEIEIIPGVTSFAQLASIRSVPLVLDDESLCVISGTASKLKIKMALEMFDNIVIMKVKRHLKKILPLIQSLDLSSTSYLISNAGMTDEKIYEDLNGLTGKEDLSYFSTLIVQRRNEGKK